MKKSFWILMVLAVLVVVFSVQNAEPVHFTLFMWQGELSLAILLISTFIVGAIVGALYYGIAMRNKRKNKNANIAKDIPFEVEDTHVNEETEMNESDKDLKE